MAAAEKELQQAITLDPKFLRAHLGLAAAFGSEGKYDSARKEIDLALTLNPDEPDAHRLLGTLLIFQTNMDGAVAELRKAIALDPDQSDANARLGQIYVLRGELDQALAAFKAAQQAAPFDSKASAGLAQVYAIKGDEVSARAELSDAMRFAPTNNLDANLIAGCYVLLHDPYSAVQYYKQFLPVARKSGLNLGLVDEFEKHVEELEARLTPHYLTYAMPVSYTPQELEKALQAKLTSAEFAQVTNPFASTPEMRAWAEKTTQGLTNDLDKAQALFQAVTRQCRFEDTSGIRGAREVFAKMADKTATFNCVEGAHLCVALGRDIGLKIFQAMVVRDYTDEVVQHACAALFIKTNVLLIDPSYNWFGVPHKEVTVLDDVQAIGMDFFQRGDLDAKSALARCEMGEKLFPNCEVGIIIHFSALMESGQWEAARNLISAALKASRQGWMLAVESGLLAQHDGQPEQALNFFLEANQLNPNYGRLHVWIAEELSRKGELSEARKECQAALRCDLPSKLRDMALQAIAAINERLSGH
jgi:Flp pilus assembly protein TadD